MLPPEHSKVFNQLLETNKYANENEMKINLKKTKLMMFNPCKQVDFMPKFNLDDCELELEEHSKLLGLILKSDLKWDKNTEYLTKRASKKLWILRRLKNLGASKKSLVDVYCKHCRSILELAAPVWHSSITEKERKDFERVQKNALHIILGEEYGSYSEALKKTNLETLDKRRNKLCLKFARKCEKNPKFKHWFKLKPEKQFRIQGDKYFPTFARTERLKRSPISYLTDLLNEYYKMKK